MYKLVSGISMFLRTFIFPNPFERYVGLYLQNTVFMSASSEIAYIFNLTIGGAILWCICYPLVGIIYDSGECPTIGSIIYGGLILINSKILVMITQGLTEVNTSAFLWRFGIALVIESIILIGIRRVKNYLSFY